MSVHRSFAKFLVLESIIVFATVSFIELASLEFYTSMVAAGTGVAIAAVGIFIFRKAAVR